MQRVRWGVLSTARIGLEKVIPAMRQGRYCRLDAIASRDLTKARTAAAKLQIPRAYGSYQQLLADPEIDAIYNPLPNHLHVPWSIKSLQAGKHVLCEKPIAVNAAEAQLLLAAAREHPRLKVMEAFMYRHHPQWQESLRRAGGGEIGELRSIHSYFSYYNDDPDNIRNQADLAGGGLMDIGCYSVSLSRLIFGLEPQRVCAVIELDPHWNVDYLCSGLLDFGGRHATFTCSTQLTPYQRVHIFGTRGRIEIEIPFNAPPERPCRIWLQRRAEILEVQLDKCDQYTVQGDLFSRAVLEDTPVPTPLEDAVANMRVIDALFSSAESGAWVNL
ncbi:MAG: Gfo/Idh/MocA family protein [Acidobacteriota bacterium]